MNNLEVANINWEDANFYGFIWVNDGKDLELNIQHASLPIYGVLCRWSHNLNANLSWERSMQSKSGEPVYIAGPLLVHTGGIVLKQNNNYFVSFFFGLQGELSFTCSQIEISTKNA